VMKCTRPDISHAVGVVSRYIANQGTKHWETMKWVLRYLISKSVCSITYIGCSDLVCGYDDSDFSSNLDKMRSTPNYVFTLAWVTCMQWDNLVNESIG
jgi:ATP-binding cassette subfamily B (MDR/TAP) protein 1